MANPNSIVQAKEVQNLLVIDPTANGMANVNVEDLSISVELEVFKRDETPVIFTDGKVTTGNVTNPEATRISFIDGAGGEDHLTTHYTELTTDFGKEKDVGSLGIESIDISFNTSYVPIVKIKFKDIRARLFEMGDESPYSFLFKMPYPIFYLTVKGYYGKPVKYALHLTKFNGQLDNDTGSFIITCDFIGYTYAFLADLLMGILKGTPYTVLGQSLMEPDFVTFEELTAVVSKLQENISKFNEDNKQLRALSIYADLSSKLDAIATNLITTIDGNINPAYKIIEDSNLIGGTWVSWGGNSGGLAGTLNQLEQDIYQRDVLDLVDQYINLNNEKGIDTYKLNKDDFELENSGVFLSHYNTSDFIFNNGAINSLPKTFKEFQTNSNLLNKYPNYSTIGDTDSEKKYNQFIQILNKKSLNFNNFTYTFKENQSLFDIRFAMDKINALKESISNDYKEAKKEVTASFVDGITEYLKSEKSVFDASIGSLFKILCGHVDLFVKVIKALEKQVKDDVSGGHRTILKADKNNFSEYADATGETEIQVNAFPEYIEKEIITDSNDVSNSTLVEKWLGSNIKFRNYKEVIFIDDLYDSMIKAAKKDRENLENNVFIEKLWYPVNPMETKAFDIKNTNPWDITKEATVLPIMKLMTQRMSLFLGYSNKNLTETEITNMAKIEANQLNEAVTSPNVKKAIVIVNTDDNDITKRVLTNLGNGETTWGQLGELYNLRLYFDDEFFDEFDSYIYSQGGAQATVDTVSSIQEIPITQTFGDLKAATNSSIYAGSSLVSEGTNETFIKIMPHNTYNQTYQHENWLGGSEPSVDTKKINRDSNVSNVNDIYSGIYKTHEFSRYINGDLAKNIDGYHLSYEFYDKELKVNLLQNAKNNIPFSFQSEFISNGKEFSLFGSDWYHSQETEVAKALLFLHSIPFDGVNITDSPTSYTPTHGILSDKNLKFFNERAGFVLVPDSWLLLLGGLLYRDSLSEDILKFEDNGESLIPNIDDLNNISTSQYLINYVNVPDSTTKLFSNSAINFENRNNDIYSQLSNVLLRLPNSVKTILIIHFNTWVGKGWLALKEELEIFDANGVIINNDNYESPIENVDFPNNYGLKLIDTLKGSDDLNVFLGSKKTLMNSTFRIWQGSNQEYNKITMKSSDFKLYIDTFYKELSRLNDKPTLDETSQIQQQLFNTDNVDDIKLSLYKNVKSVYNKWIVGVNPEVDPVILSNLYDSFNFLDRAHIDISNNFKISPTKFVEFLSTSSNMNFYSFIARILSENNFDFIPLPTFLDYSSAENLTSVFEPQRFSDQAPAHGPTFVCMYFGEQSNKLNVSKKDDRGDSFKIPSKYDKDGNLDISDGSDLPDDFKTGNRNIPYFLVNYADQNQSLFKNINLNQAEFTETNESLEIIESLSRRNRNNSIGQNLFDIYSNRAYSAEVEMLGNAQIQPFMFFQINNIPMFDGAYTIINTSHHIKANHMTTTFKGVRIRKVKTKMIDNETLYAHLLANLNEVDNEDATLSDIGVITDPDATRSTTNNNTALPDASEGIPDKIKGTFVNPLAETLVVSDFGSRTLNGKADYHGGTDFRAAVGTPISAVTDSIVYRVRRQNNGNLYVDFKIKPRKDVDSDFYVRYMHLSELTHPQLTGFDVSNNGVDYFPTGITIPKGTVFAKTGDSGGVTEHLHMDIRNTASVKPDTIYKKTQWFFDTTDWRFKSGQQQLDKTVTT